MDVHKFIEGHTHPAYMQWANTHPHATISEEDYVSEVVLTRSFQEWYQANPSGTVDEYLNMCRQVQAYYNSPQYLLQEAENQIAVLEEEVSELKDDVEEYCEEIESMQSTNTGLWVTSGTFFLTTLILLFVVVRNRIKIKKKKEDITEQ